MNWSRRWKTIFDGITTVAVLAAALAIIHSTYFRGNTRRRELAVPTAPVSLSDVQIIGDDRAPVGVIVLTDFQCPYCGTFARETLPAIQESHVRTGKALIAYRHFPLNQIHPAAAKAAAVAVCASKQGLFLEVHDEFFKNQKALLEEDPIHLARRAGANGQQLDDCVKSVGVNAVTTDVEWGRSIGVNSTPTFLVGVVENSSLRVTRTARGSISAADLRALMDEAALPETSYGQLAAVSVAALGLGVVVVVGYLRRRQRTPGRTELSGV